MSTTVSSSIKASCSCGKKYLVNPKNAGKRGKCKCGQFFVVPPLNEKSPPKSQSSIWHCNTCGATLSADKASCARCERKSAFAQATDQAGSDSLGTTGMIVIGSVIGVMCMGIQALLDSPSYWLFYASVGLIGFVILVTSRIIKASDQTVRGLTWAATICLGLIPIGRLLYILFDIYNREIAGLHFLMIAIGPAMLFVSSNLDRCLSTIYESDESASRLHWWNDPRVQISLAVGIVTVLATGVVQLQLKGPEFIQVYLGVAVLLAVCALAARLTSSPRIIFLFLFLAFEAVGAIRWGYGAWQGMHRFDTLHNMMLFGAFVIGVIAFAGTGDGTGSGDYSSYGSSCSTGSSCSSGSSCGGGGCGGGGCGGCGS